MRPSNDNMDPADILHVGTRDAAALMAGGELYAVQGHTATRELRVLSMAQLYMGNATAFACGHHHGFLLLGLFASREAAEEYCASLRALFHEGDGGVLVHT